MRYVFLQRRVGCSHPIPAASCLETCREDSAGDGEGGETAFQGGRGASPGALGALSGGLEASPEA
jgi:hypothetical protein